jgi:protein PhnA
MVTCLRRLQCLTGGLRRLKPVPDICDIPAGFPVRDSLGVNTTMAEYPKCPKCSSEFAYADGALLICPECAHEWSSAAVSPSDTNDGPRVIKDANGNVLTDGDSVTVIKDLKIKGSSAVVKVGTKVRNIRIIDGAGGHDIDCKIDGIGPMQLKSEFVKKA